MTDAELVNEIARRARELPNLFLTEQEYAQARSIAPDAPYIEYLDKNVWYAEWPEKYDFVDALERAIARRVTKKLTGAAT